MFHLKSSIRLYFVANISVVSRYDESFWNFLLRLCIACESTIYLERYVWSCYGYEWKRNVSLTLKPKSSSDTFNRQRNRLELWRVCLLSKTTSLFWLNLKCTKEDIGSRMPSIWRLFYSLFFPQSDTKRRPSERNVHHVKFHRLYISKQILQKWLWSKCQIFIQWWLR